MVQTTVLILDRDRDMAARLAASAAVTTAAASGELILTGCDAAIGELVMRRMPLSTLIVDANLDGLFSSAVLDLVRTTRKRWPDCRVVVTGDEISDALTNELLRRGAADVITRFAAVSGAAANADRRSTVIHIPCIDELIDSDHLTPAFQPIVNLSDKGGHGYESLARYDARSLPFCDPQFMFEYARLAGKTAELELACMRRTLRQAGGLRRDANLFININPLALAEGDRLTNVLLQEASDNGVALDRVVLEITEQERLDASPQISDTIEELRAHGVRFALDDVGIAYSHLDRLECIKPSYLKISHEFGTGFEKDSTRRKIIRNIVSLAADFECEVVLEGVETAETSGAAADIGARYAQGFFFARPQVAGAFA